MVASLAEAQSHPVTPEDFLAIDALVRTAKREMEDSSAALARAKKDAKGKAVDMIAYKFVEAMRKLDEEVRPVVYRNFIAYMGWLEMPLGTQASMIDAPKVPKPKPAARSEHSVWAAGEAGLLAGREGDAASANPHSAGTQQHVAWAKKHTEGLQERATAARMSDDTEDQRPADTATATKRGRKATSAAARAAQAQEKALKQLNGDTAPN
jgi:hypothetical protein